MALIFTLALIGVYDAWLSQNPMIPSFKNGSSIPVSSEEMPIFGKPCVQSGPSFSWVSGYCSTRSVSTTGRLLRAANLTVSYRIIGGGSGYSAPILNYVYDGIQHSVPLTGTDTIFRVDNGSLWRVTDNPLPGSGGEERWYSNQTLSGAASGSVNFTFYFYHQFLQRVSYSVRNGGLPYYPAIYRGVGFGSTISVAMKITPEDYWFDAGAHWSVSNPIPSSSSQERWYTSQGSNGTIDRARTVFFQYSHQYLLSVSASPGGYGMVAPRSGWVDAGSRLDISAIPIGNHIFQSWVGVGFGSFTGSSNSAEITMIGPIQETARFKMIDVPARSSSL